MRTKGRGLIEALRIWVAALAIAVSSAPARPVLAQSCTGTTSSAYLDFLVTFKGVGMITDLTATPGPSRNQITLTWTAPAYNGGNLPLTYSVAASTTGNIPNTGAFNAANPLSAFSSSFTFPPLVPGTTQTMVVSNLAAGLTYCFAIRARDAAAPPAIGAWLERPPKYNPNNCAALGTAPMPPLGVAISTSAASPTLSWSQVTLYVDGTPFAVSTAPKPIELQGYRVQRATAPILAPWTDLSGLLSTATLSWTDLSATLPAYYRVESENLSGDSPSMLRDNPGRNLWSVGYDGVSTLEIPDVWTPALSNYWIEGSNQVLQADNRVLKNFTLTAKRNGYIPDPSVVLGGISNLNLHYAMSASTPGAVAPSSLGPAALQPASPQNLSVFWFDGNKWLQFYGKLDAVNQTLYVQTQYLGYYQIRAGERTQGFSFNSINVVNREITPNGDNKNDTAEFQFDNPQGSDVTGRVFDLKGAFVANMLPCPDKPMTPPQCLMWDGKAGGAVVPGGVYIYQIQAEGKTYSGTVLVIK